MRNATNSGRHIGRKFSRPMSESRAETTLFAETGTLVIHPKKGVSRLTSLAPPVHITVMKHGQVLPSLDELFLLEHVDIHSGERHAAMNLISGPSRTGDIEATIVHGIHGPVETHIVLVG